MSYKFFTPTIVGLILLFPLVSLGADPTYTPLVGVPGVDDPTLEFGDYINALYALSISIAALLAVIKIVIAGMKYMLSDIVTSKSEAISDIQGAVFGLIVVISAVLILTVINPNLTETEIFLDPVKNAPSAGGGGGGGGGYTGTSLNLPIIIACPKTGEKVTDPYGGTTDVYDCSVSDKACENAGGKTTGIKTNDLICSFGTPVNYGCEVKMYDSGPNIGQNYSDCASVTAKCEQKGTAHVAADGASITCVIPF